jgi:lipoate-protein ligase A
LVHEPTITAAISVALEGKKKKLSNHTYEKLTSQTGLPYTFNAVDQAIEKINLEVPGLINSENGHIAKDIRNWLQERL